jgi:hypothetical protein
VTARPPTAEEVRAYEVQLSRWNPCRFCYFACMIIMPALAAGACYAAYVCWTSGWDVAGFFAGFVAFLLVTCSNCDRHVNPPKLKVPE